MDTDVHWTEVNHHPLHLYYHSDQENLLSDGSNLISKYEELIIKGNLILCRHDSDNNVPRLLLQSLCFVLKHFPIKFTITFVCGRPINRVLLSEEMLVNLLQII